MKAGDRQREFNFRQLNAGNEVKYNVDVPDERGNRIAFQMTRNSEGNWSTEAQNLPSWVVGAQPMLSDAIIEHLSQISNR